jgi:hypothetical protein
VATVHLLRASFIKPPTTTTTTIGGLVRQRTRARARIHGERKTNRPECEPIERIKDPKKRIDIEKEVSFLHSIFSWPTPHVRVVDPTFFSYVGFAAALFMAVVDAVVARPSAFFGIWPRARNARVLATSFGDWQRTEQTLLFLSDVHFMRLPAPLDPFDRLLLLLQVAIGSLRTNTYILIHLEARPRSCR